jgi:hypothetical protein
MSRILIATALLIAGVGAVTAQSDVERAYTAFNGRIDAYVQMHRRIEGPVPPLTVSQDLTEVRRLMTDVRRRIKHEGASEQGRYFTRDLTLVLRKQIATVMARKDVQELVDEVVEHTPPGMPAPRVYEPLPPDAPFAQIPPRLFKVLPTLPPELRYVVVGKALVLWDHHADLVIDIAPGLFDPKAFWSQSEN